MAVEIIDNKFSSQAFNKMVYHPLQTWEWGKARSDMNVTVVRMKDGENAYQMTLHPIPKTNFKIGYLPRSVYPSKKLLDFLYEFGKKNNIVFIKIEPYEEKNNIKLDKRLKRSPHPLFPDWTQIMDLKDTEENLLKKMHSKTRYNIRLAIKKGVEVREESNDQGFSIFTKLYFETCKRQKYFGHDHKYHKIVWNNLKNSIAHILVAYYNDTPLAAYELFYFKDYLYYVYGGTSDQFRNVMAANLIMWETIRLGKKLGAKKLDMWGSLPPVYSQSHSWAGFTRFKEGYGTKFVEMIGSYDLVVNPFLYNVYNTVHRVRDQYLKLRRLF